MLGELRLLARERPQLLERLERPELALDLQQPLDIEERGRVVALEHCPFRAGDEFAKELEVGLGREGLAWCSLRGAGTREIRAIRGSCLRREDALDAAAKAGVAEDGFGNCALTRALRRKFEHAIALCPSPTRSSALSCHRCHVPRKEKESQWDFAGARNGDEGSERCVAKKKRRECADGTAQLVVGTYCRSGCRPPEASDERIAPMTTVWSPQRYSASTSQRYRR
jgi:hypothetical protein